MDGDVRARLLSANLITVEPTRLDHSETEALVAELTDDLRDRYGDEDALYELGVHEFTAATFPGTRIAACAYQRIPNFEP